MGARSGRYGVCWWTSNSSSWRVVLTTCAMWGLALSWSKLAWPCRSVLFSGTASFIRCNWTVPPNAHHFFYGDPSWLSAFACLLGLPTAFFASYWRTRTTFILCDNSVQKDDYMLLDGGRSVEQQVNFFLELVRHPSSDFFDIFHRIKMIEDYVTIADYFAANSRRVLQPSSVKSVFKCFLSYFAVAIFGLCKPFLSSRYA